MDINDSGEKMVKVAKIEKPPFWEPHNMKISPAKIQKSVGKKLGQLLSRDRSPKNRFA